MINSINDLIILGSQILLASGFSAYVMNETDFFGLDDPRVPEDHTVLATIYKIVVWIAVFAFSLTVIFWIFDGLEFLYSKWFMWHHHWVADAWKWIV